MTSEQFVALKQRMTAKSRPSDTSPLPKPLPTPDAVTGRVYRSKLERDFHLHIRDTYLYCEHEPIRLRLARGAHYTPDFITEDDHGKLVAWEVKGFWREAARVRIKVAARLFPWLKFVAVRRLPRADGGGWHFEEILP